MSGGDGNLGKVGVIRVSVSADGFPREEGVGAGRSIVGMRPVDLREELPLFP